MLEKENHLSEVELLSLIGRDWEVKTGENRLRGSVEKIIIRHEEDLSEGTRILEIHPRPLCAESAADNWNPIRLPSKSRITFNLDDFLSHVIRFDDMFILNRSVGVFIIHGKGDNLTLEE